MQRIFLIIIILMLQIQEASCVINTLFTIERFNISRFESQKDETGEYYYYLADSSRVREFGTDNSYTQEIYKPDGRTVIHKYFYKNGAYKGGGTLYYNIPIGIWKSFDKDQKLISEINKDENFPVTIDQIKTIVKKEYDINLDTSFAKPIFYRFYSNDNDESIYYIDQERYNFTGYYEHSDVYLIDGRTGKSLFHATYLLDEGHEDFYEIYRKTLVKSGHTFP